MPLIKTTVMKIGFLFLVALLGVMITHGQATSSDVAVITTYSQNEKYYLNSTPYDDEFPTLRGKTSVYATGNPVPLYAFDRGFDSVEEDSNNLILSNDGQVIFFAITFEANENREGLKSVTIYKHGKIIKSFTQTEVNGCDLRQERCSLVYQNYDQVVDQEKSQFGTANYKRIFKENVSEKEKFLNDFAIFAFDDLVYVTDSKKVVHIFDLHSGDIVRSAPFDSIYDELKTKARLNRTGLKHYEAPTYLQFPKMKDGRDTHRVLASYLGMKPADLAEQKDEKFKLYTAKISLGILRAGVAEVESIDVDDGLPKEKILNFFNTNRFDISEVPSAFEKWYLTEEYLSFRNSNDKIAREEKQSEIAEARKSREKRMTLERINGVYIPKDLGECFVELDKLLTEIDKKEMQSQPKREDMIAYHLSLGMWMRNNWSLWSGSRLYKYFEDKGLRDPEDMSSIVLFYYYDWLKGKKDSWKQWEANPKRPFAEPADQRFTNSINERPRP